MDLPRDVWAIVRQHKDTTEWGKACGACHATFALRPFLTAAVRSDPSIDGQGFLRELELDKCCACQLHKAVELSVAQTKHITQPSSAMPLLYCLHIKGRPQVPLKEGSIEDVLMRLVAVLVLEANSKRGGGERMHQEVFRSIGLLTGLKTLCVQFIHAILKGPADLRSCAHPREVALTDVYLEGFVALPAGCLLHSTCEPQRIQEVTLAFRDFITGLTLRHTKSRKLSTYPCKQILQGAPKLEKLEDLQLILSKEDLNNEDVQLEFGLADLGPHMTPSLRALELNVDCNLVVSIGTALPLRWLVIAATGTLNLTFRKRRTYSFVCSSPREAMSTLTHMYLQSGAMFSASCKDYLETSAPAQVSFVKMVKEKQWTAQMPASFQPNFQWCRCNACSQCLAQTHDLKHEGGMSHSLIMRSPRVMVWPQEVRMRRILVIARVSASPN